MYVAFYTRVLSFRSVVFLNEYSFLILILHLLCLHAIASLWILLCRPWHPWEVSLAALAVINSRTFCLSETAFCPQHRGLLPWVDTSGWTAVSSSTLKTLSARRVAPPPFKCPCPHSCLCKDLPVLSRCFCSLSLEYFQLRFHWVFSFYPSWFFLELLKVGGLSLSKSSGEILALFLFFLLTLNFAIISS